MGMEMEAETFGHHDSDSAGEFGINGIFWGMRLSGGGLLVTSLSFWCGSKISPSPMRWSV